MSAVVHVTPIDAPRGVRFDVLERITAAAFGQRRKMLRQSLKGVPGALAALDALGIDSTRRAATVSVDEFITLARALSSCLLGLRGGLGLVFGPCCKRGRGRALGDRAPARAHLGARPCHSPAALRKIAPDLP